MYNNRMLLFTAPGRFKTYWRPLSKFESEKVGRGTTDSLYRPLPVQRSVPHVWRLSSYYPSLVGNLALQEWNATPR